MARTLRKRLAGLLFPLVGVAVLLAGWQLGALIVSGSSDRPEEVWPSIQYVIGTSLPDIAILGDAPGASGAPAVGAEADVPPPAAPEAGGGSYGQAFEVLGREAWATTRRVLVGTAVGTALGVILGLAMGLSTVGRRTLYPVLNVLRQVPLLSLTLLFAVWFGGSETGIYVFVAYGVTVMIMMNTLGAVVNVSGVYERYARTLGASRRRVIRTVVIPAIVPEVASGILVALGLAWAMVLGGEFLGVQDGLGRMVILFEAFGLAGQMVVVLATLLVLAVLAHVLVSTALARATRWVPRR